MRRSWSIRKFKILGFVADIGLRLPHCDVEACWIDFLELHGITMVRISKACLYTSWTPGCLPKSQDVNCVVAAPAMQ